ncbi:hypothetical protein CAAU_2669 [Caloramator australicus RC3]|uniref:Uncharacterized protein n=1 Tax=Caloramator australicus RC3 TaxID=857293 RepID=I7KAG7_9CLOT|nr:hypothetical protein CAAU_2669 [Caloramator australicus RC3]
MCYISILYPISVFQSLIGRLRTKKEAKGEKEGKVSIPHR